jgi:methylated-DNA-protein-cysteine methyltransferase-like protein
MTTFASRVVKLALSIPPGRVTTYGAIARAAGGGGQAARSVSSILGKAYDAGEKGIPFHRIVYAGGVVWTSSVHDAERKKRYKKEGILIGKKNKIVNFREIFFSFE